MSIIKSPVRREQVIEMQAYTSKRVSGRGVWGELGSVALVGAGPGDPELLTIAAGKALQTADVVVHDALVSPEILALIPDSCEIISVGKRCGKHSASQDDISETLIQLAQAGRQVVRLKGGDPFLFGRGGEEVEKLAEAGIPFRVIPGLTAGIAGPAYAGIPVTHRKINANVAFITGHEAILDDDESLSSTDFSKSRLDWEAMAKAFPVMVLYMTMKNIDPITKRLMAAGRCPDTPIAFIRWATTPRQQTLISTLAKAVEDVANYNLQSPAIVVVGEVVRLRQVMAWFPDEMLKEMAREEGVEYAVG